MPYGMSPEILDLLMGGFGGGGGGAPNLPQERELDFSDLDVGPDDEFEGDSLQEFYDYLMKPRHRREAWSSPGGGMHGYGPAREATISPENMQMAELIKGRMDEDRARKETERRMTRAESLMTGRGPGAGGTMSVPGKEPITIGPKGPLTPEEQAEAMAGGVPMEPMIAADAKRAETDRRDALATQKQIMAYEKNAAAYQLKIAEFKENFEKDRSKYEGEGGQLQNYVGVPAEELKRMWKNGELPEGVKTFLGKHFIQWDENERLAGEELAKAGALRESLGGAEGSARVDRVVTGSGEVLGPDGV